MTAKQYNLYDSEDTFVTRIVMDDESSQELFDLIATENGGSRWEVYRHNKPFPSWIEDGDSDWKAPVEYPNDGKDYFWDEIDIAWKEILD